MGQRSIGQGAGFVSERGIFAAGQFLDQRAAGEAAGFLVRVDHHIVSDPRGALHRLERLQRMEDDIEAALHIGSAGAVDRVIVDPADLLKRVIDGEDRVHVAGQHEAPFRIGPDAQHHVPPVRFFEFAPFGGYGSYGRRVDQFDVARQDAESIGQDAGHAIQPFDIGGAGIDGRPVLYLAQHRIGIDRVEQGLRCNIRFHVQRP